ncbi:MAG: hypothetical protein PHP11_05870 [Erysipelotrichaceae bacterium]|nr:hypothetical protein [Erysipelotrichaceae bacterium]
MAYRIVTLYPQEMLKKKEEVLVSLFLPTHRIFPDNKKDLILYKNALKELENKLQPKVDDEIFKQITDPLYQLKDDREFWDHNHEGLAIFADLNECVIYRLDDEVEMLTVVSDSFYVKPLLKAEQLKQDYLLLGINRDDFKLFQGNKSGISEIKLPNDILKTRIEVLGDQLSEPYLTHGSYGGTGGMAMYHGHGDIKQEIDKDTQKYFRYIDDLVYQRYVKESKMPVILVALKEHQSDFRRISSALPLIEKGILQSIDSLSFVELNEKAKELIKELNLDKMNAIISEFKQAQGNSQGSSDIAQIAKAIFDKRVKTILLDDQKQVFGTYDEESGTVMFDDAQHDDILDDLTEAALKQKAEVIVLPSSLMPSETGIAVIFRY